VGLYEEPETVVNYDTSIICHFTFPIGNFGHKYYRMKNFFTNLMKVEPVPGAPSVDATKKYVLTWESNIITIHNGVVYTPWGAGTAKHLHTNCFEATWNTYSHIVYVYKDTFLSVRTFPLDFGIVAGTYT